MKKKEKKERTEKKERKKVGGGRIHIFLPQLRLKADVFAYVFPLDPDATSKHPCA